MNAYLKPVETTHGAEEPLKVPPPVSALIAGRPKNGDGPLIGPVPQRCCADPKEVSRLADAEQTTTKNCLKISHRSSPPRNRLPLNYRLIPYKT